MIEGVKIKKLKVIPDERGRLMEMLRADDDLFMRFGQVYMTTAYPGAVKAWHYHKKQVDNFVVVKGMMKVVLFDGRESSPTSGRLMNFSWENIIPFFCKFRPMSTMVSNASARVRPS